MDAITIRSATASDANRIWEIFSEVIAPGDTFVFDPATTREEFTAFWFGPKAHSYVAESGPRIVGSYVFKPNQPGLGSHVANAAYMVCPSARGLGLGRLMCEHSLSEARRLGFSAMQFNAVVSTNTTAVNLWKKFGFRIIATVPRGFHHAQLGYVDLHIMFRELGETP